MPRDNVEGHSDRSSSVGAGARLVLLSRMTQASLLWFAFLYFGLTQLPGVRVPQYLPMGTMVTPSPSSEYFLQGCSSAATGAFSSCAVNARRCNSALEGWPLGRPSFRYETQQAAVTMLRGSA
jgi:hypothetical protein